MEVETEEGSLKKGREEEGIGFRRSNMTLRSPVKAQEGGVLRALDGGLQRKVGKDGGEYGGHQEGTEEMRKREEDWRVEKERMEKTIGELEIK